jgi:hypothetical protein
VSDVSDESQRGALGGLHDVDELRAEGERWMAECARLRSQLAAADALREAVAHDGGPWDYAGHCLACGASVNDGHDDGCAWTTFDRARRGGA